MPRKIRRTAVTVRARSAPGGQILKRLYDDVTKALAGLLKVIKLPGDREVERFSVAILLSERFELVSLRDRAPEIGARTRSVSPVLEISSSIATPNPMPPLQRTAEDVVPIVIETRDGLVGQKRHANQGEEYEECCNIPLILAARSRFLLRWRWRC
ncbi:MAG: hypothetical protein GY811_16895 [Myxococcales bacterium]|nr:hypothetical protein [Myxococcales bacterium]